MHVGLVQRYQMEARACLSLGPCQEPLECLIAHLGELARLLGIIKRHLPDRDAEVKGVVTETVDGVQRCEHTGGCFTEVKVKQGS